MNFLHSISELIAKAIIIPLVAVASFAGYTIPVSAPTQSVTLGAFNPTGGGTYRLQTSAGSTDTSIRLSSFKEPISNIPYTMAYMNTSVAYGTIDPQQPTRREFISFTGITQNSDGTAVLTGVSRGLSGSYPYTASSTLRQAHAGQSIFILSDSPQLFNQYAVKSNTETITGAWTFASTAPALYDGLFTVSTSSLQIPYASWIANNFVDTSNTQNVNALKTFTSGIYATASSTFSSTLNISYNTASTSAASVGYVNSVAIAGSPDASQTVKGIVEEATVSEINSGASTGGTGAKLFITPASFSVSSFASSTKALTLIPTPYGTYNVTSNKVVTAALLTSSTTANIGLINIPVAIDLIKVSTQYVNTQPKLSFGIGLYTESGVNMFSTTTSPLSSSCSGGTNGCNLTLTLSSTTTIPVGNYYILVVPQDGNNSQILTWSTTDTPVLKSLQMTGLQKWSGTYTTGAGIIPASITPSSISTTTGDTIPFMRFDAQ